MKYEYDFVTGAKEVEIDKKWADILTDLDRDEYNSSRKISKNCLFFNSNEEYSDWGAKEDENILALIGEKSFSDKMLEKLPQAIAQLKPAQREIIYATYFDGLTQAEYAERLGINQSNVSRRLTTAEKNLKKFLEKTA